MGRIYTPLFIVENILDLVDYNNQKIIGKHIIDNSCGDGAFLIEIVKRYCQNFLNNKKNDILQLKNHLEKYIHGIEIDRDEYLKCINNLNDEAQKYGVNNINWDILCADTLMVEKYNHKMDYVVGNPPYVRVHNLAENYDNVKKFSFCENGMTDLYIVFFEIGFNMLSKNGKMCLITPNSCLNSNAGKGFREYVYRNKNLTKIVDLGHFQPFPATTYTMISLFENNKKVDGVNYCLYDEEKLKPQEKEIIYYDRIFINGGIYLSDGKGISLLHSIETSYKAASKRIEVKNGFATLADNIFIGDFNFNRHVIDIYKASTGKWKKCIFPYNEMGKNISIDEIKDNEEVLEYLINKKEILEKRSLTNKDHWYLFGRTQAIKDVFKNKIAINTIIKDINSIKLEKIPAGSGIYSGLYILTDYDYNTIKDIIISDEFVEYVKLLKKYKSGGYYTFSSIDLNKYLTYKI